MDFPRSAALERIPDDPLHVEARGLLLRPRPAVVASRDGQRGFAVSVAHRLAAAFGAPGELELDDLAILARQSGIPEGSLELHGTLDDVEGWAGTGRCEPSAPLVTYHWSTGATERLGDHARHEARELAEDDALFDTLPRRLRDELDALDDFPASAAALAGRAIASLAYSFVETETLWDLSIETVPEFRREGFGASAAAFLIGRRLERGLRPVWITSEANGASRALARQLGFCEAGRSGCARLTAAR